ncbi:uncharacterized protein LOC115620521 [Scaptodrosophila lebanonensis]|uniref:Uncharacterized protein LOC115620521 n=1 Tax=Drosophila lebanonensis TaxID=7225 RepID=A0A6J2SYI4_DROLE|nr:uncharacterized protein LOC115620521 [Scaptodrosophila lebanonensis]
MCIVVPHCCCASCHASLRFGCIFYAVWAIIWRILLGTVVLVPTGEDPDVGTYDVISGVLHIICLVGPISLLIGIFKIIKALVILSIVVTYVVVGVSFLHLVVFHIVVGTTDKHNYPKWVNTTTVMRAAILKFFAIFCPLAGFEVYMAIVQYSFLKTEM